ncbi:TPA: hypothetical protein ACMDXH_000747 [Vibrio parahaemolyticus]|nr:hypothetical protein [Vibrio parahaemolyticus]EHY8553051.1 hypothetical protein [Vibrio parahaemolyticus]EIA9327230.1 hypothetical protein [Vibrio parahaemolyticus]EJV9414073.1 hypothetical protein [Vibrio vulnificus]
MKNVRKKFSDGKEYTPFRMNMEVELIDFLDAERPEGVSLTKHINHILQRHKDVKESRNGKPRK